MPSDGSIDDEVTRRKAAEERLLISYAELQKAHEELKISQKRLIENEKMASLGLLSAGVAHEINNPVGYILSNISTLADYLPKIDKTYLELRSLIRDIAPDNPLYERRLGIEQAIEERDIEYLRGDTQDLVRETREGANRVLDIVQGLKDFARSNDDVMTLSDINECLQSTLKLVNNELKYHCRIETNLAPLPQVVCSLSKLGQVFMNILINAGHAITEDGLITVTTHSDEERVYITIEDTGSGMSEATLAKIFVPFYTTKPKGQGTGLGLAISAGIVEEHGGTIHATSVPGSGTTFTIELPLFGPGKEAQVSS